MDNKKMLLIALVVLFLIVAIACNCNKKVLVERYVAGLSVRNQPVHHEEYRFPNKNMVKRHGLIPDAPPRVTDDSMVGHLKGPQPPISARGDSGSMEDYIKMVEDPDDIPEEMKKVGDNEVSFEDPLEYQEASLPESNMEAMNFGKDPSDPQVYIYDRMIYANQKRRNNTNADLIRGDIPIANINSHAGWHQVSVVPHLDTVMGALGSGAIGSAFSHIGAQYETNISETGDVNVIKEVPVNVIPSVQSF
jgi:hypothetical protein